MNPGNCLKISLVANGVLLAGVVWLSLRPAPPPARRAASPAPAARSPSPHAADETRTAPLDWPDSIAELRHARVPGAIIAKVVIERIAQKWTPLEAKFEQQFLNGEIDANRLAELHEERAREEEHALRAALGEGYREWHRQEIVQNMNLGGVQPSEAQKEPLYLIEIGWRARLQELERAKRHGRLDQTAFDRAVAQAEVDYKHQLAAVVGRERIFGEPVVNDPRAQLSRDFEELQVTDAQLHELAAVQKTWSDTRSAMAESLQRDKTIDGAFDGDLHALDRARDEDYRRILGEDAFDSWQRSRDDRYRLLRNRAQSWDLDPQRVENVYQLIRSYDLAIAAYEHQAQVSAQGGQLVDWTNVQTAVAEYTRQTEATLRQTLGHDRFEQMQAMGAFGLRQSAGPDPARPGRDTPP